MSFNLKKGKLYSVEKKENSKKYRFVNFFYLSKEENISGNIVNDEMPLVVMYLSDFEQGSFVYYKFLYKDKLIAMQREFFCNSLIRVRNLKKLIKEK